jgi:hypothetical protein
MALSPDHPQYGEMVRRMGEEGGFTYNPRKDKYETEGWAVSPHKGLESVAPASQTTPGRMQGYHAEHEDVLAQKPNMMGGWRSGEGTGAKDYLDVSKVYPPTGGGHSAARYQAVKHSQEATFNLGTFEEEQNPFMNKEKFPEFHALATSGQSMSQVMKKAPEMEAWVQGPSRRERFEQGR